MTTNTPRPETPGGPGRAPAAVTVLVLLAAAAAVGYGMWGHAVTVWLKPEGAAETPPEAAVSDETLKMMGFTPPPKPEPKEGVTTLAELEPRLVKEVSVGGVTRLASGDIQRTYSGDAPTQCPT